jgi:LmbE family N-acetylglucosaminyl deacetylase
VRSVLCLGAHADDIEIGCGGTILRLAQECPGLRVHWVVFGAEGVRRAEAHSSAQRFLEGIPGAEVEVLHFRDRFFPAAWAEIKEFFDELGRRCSPDLVLAHRRDDAHQDHRVVGELTWNTFRRHWILEYEILKYDGDLVPPNLFVALTEALVEKKVAMLMEGFASQHAKPGYSADAFRALARIRGIEANADTAFAEGFVCRKLTL